MIQGGQKGLELQAGWPSCSYCETPDLHTEVPSSFDPFVSVTFDKKKQTPLLWEKKTETHLHKGFPILTVFLTKQSVTSRSREFPFPGIVLFFWWYRNRYQKNLVPKRVSESVSKKYGTEKSLGISIENIWYRKNLWIGLGKIWYRKKSRNRYWKLDDVQLCETQV